MGKIRVKKKKKEKYYTIAARPKKRSSQPEPTQITADRMKDEAFLWRRWWWWRNKRTSASGDVVHTTRCSASERRPLLENGPDQNGRIWTKVVRESRGCSFGPAAGEGGEGGKEENRVAWYPVAAGKRRQDGWYLTARYPASARRILAWALGGWDTFQADPLLK